MKSLFAPLALATLVTLGITPAWAGSYAYNGGNGGTWSTSTNWTPTAPATGPGTGDTANLNNAASNTTVIYDPGASGSLGALTFTESGNALNELDVRRTLQVGTTTAAAVTLGATGSGTAEILVDNFATNTANTFSIGGTTLSTVGTLNINSGGVLETQNSAGVGNVTVNANIALNGGTFYSDAGAAAGNTFIVGNFVMGSGSLVLDATPTGTFTSDANRQGLSVSGNFQVTGGTLTDVNDPTNSSVAISGSASAGNTNYLYLTTAAPIITTLTLSSSATTQQTFYSNQLLGTVALSGSVTGASKSLGAATSTGAADGAGTLFTGSIKLSNSNTATPTTTLQLASNLTQAGLNVIQPYNANGNTAGTDTFIIDTNGHTLDLSTGSTVNGNDGGVFAPNFSTVSAGSNPTSSTFTLTDTAPLGGGIIKALGFDLSHGAGVNVANDLVLNASSALKTNILSGTGTIAANSTFLYSGSGTSTLASSRAIGNLTVAIAPAGTTPTLELSSNLTAGGLVTLGTGTLNVTTPTGSTIGTVGTYNLTAAGLSGVGTITNTGSATSTVTLNGSGANTFSGIISDGGTGKSIALVLSSGTQALAGLDTYVGGTTISGGSLLAESHTALGTGAVSVASGAAFSYEATTNTTLALGSTLSLAGGSTLGTSIGNSATSAEILASGAASYSGSGAVKVNIYGGLGVANGTSTYTLLGAASGVTSATYTLGTVYNNTNFKLASTTLTASATTLTASITSQTALTNAFWVGGLSGNTTVWAASNGTTASNWSATSGGAAQVLVPGSAAAVTFSTTPSSATTLGANMSIGGLTLADATTTNAFTLAADGNTLTIGAGGITVNSGVKTGSAIAANVAVGAAQSWTNNATNALTVSGVVSGSSALTTAGTGTIVLSGVNTFTGATGISAGTLQLGNTYALQNSVVTPGASNDLTFTAGLTTFVLGGLSGSANEVLTDLAGKQIDLTLGGGNSSATYSGTLSGAGSLTKIGSGTQTLTGTNTFTGLLSLNGGALNVTAAAMNATNMGEAISFSGGTLASSGTISTGRAIILAGTGTFDTTGGNITLSGSINGGGTLTKAGTGTLTLTGAMDTYPNLTINGGTVVDGTSSVNALGAGSSGILTFAATGTQTLDLNGNSPTSGLLAGGGAGSLITNNGSTLSTLSVTGGSSRNYLGVIQDGTSAVAVNILATSQGGSGGVGGQTFGLANSYSGGTTINGGSNVTLVNTGNLGTGSVVFNTTAANNALLTLSTTSDLAIGSLSSTSTGNAGATASIATQTGHNFTINQTTAGTYGGTITGGGSVTLGSSSTAALSLSNANSYTGGTTVNAGTLYVNGGVAGTNSGTGPGAVTVNGGTLGGSGSITASNMAINGGGNLASGLAQSTTSKAVDGTHLNINNTVVTIGSSTGTANLTFALGAGTSGINGGTASTNYDFSNPNNNTTYLSLTGSTSMNFVGSTSISLVDLTNTTGANGSLSLRYFSPYLLVAAGSNADYLNLLINSGTTANPIYSLSQNDAGVNGYVVGVYTGGSGPLNPAAYTPISFAEYGSDGVTPLAVANNGAYYDPVLYLYSGNLEVVPEPGTWALMLGGFALLVVIQRRRNKQV